MSENKTKPGEFSLAEFMESLSEKRLKEANTLIELMKGITDLEPELWGPSIIGFGSVHYKYESGREGDMPLLAFSPRKSRLTIYFSEGFDIHGDELSKLGKYKTSVSCLYVNKLPDIDLKALQKMLEKSYNHHNVDSKKPKNLEEYIDNISESAKEKFEELRNIIKNHNEELVEVFSYGIIGYRIGSGKIAFYASGWKDHLALYPMPKDANLAKELRSYVHGKSSIWLKLDDELPSELIKKYVDAKIDEVKK